MKKIQLEILSATTLIFLSKDHELKRKIPIKNITHFRIKISQQGTCIFMAKDTHYTLEILNDNRLSVDQTVFELKIC